MRTTNLIGQKTVVLLDTGEAQRDLLLAINDILNKTTLHVPENGYADGYDVYQIVANHDRRLWDIQRDDPPLHPEIPAEELIDREHPFRLEVSHAAHWEDIPGVVERMAYAVDDGMTQGFIVWRHDREWRTRDV